MRRAPRKRVKAGETPATNKGPTGSDPAGPSQCVACIYESESGLLQRSVDRRELGIEVRPQTVHDRDDRKRDARRDQTIFNRGRTGLIGQEIPENTLQNYLLLGAW